MNVNTSAAVAAVTQTRTAIDLLHDLTNMDTTDDRVLVLKDDPLALSCASWRRCQLGGTRYSDFALLTVEQEDRDLAQSVRRHYQDRVMLRRLRGRELTPFQVELYQMLSGDVRHKHMGMLYRLPFFFHEDQQRQKLLDLYEKQEPTDQDRIALSLEQPTTLTLYPVIQIYAGRRKSETQEFWWRQQQGLAVKWSVNQFNLLIGLVESIWHATSPVQIQCHCHWRNWGQLHYIEPRWPRLIWA